MRHQVTPQITKLINSGELGATFSPTQVSECLPDLPTTSVLNALSRMARAGTLRAYGTRNRRTYQAEETSTPAALENLLTALLEAEPILRRAIKIMRAIEE